MIVCGNPVTKSRPRTSNVLSEAPLIAEPISNLICSAVRSPINNLYLSLTNLIISASITSPAIFNDELVTMSPKDNTAISVVPPPISITIFPVGLLISRPAPIAATFGSSSINTFLAPHLSATSLIADFSIDVIFDGQQIKIVGLAKIPFKFNLLIK